MKDFLIRKGLQQGKEIAAETDGYFHSVCGNAVLVQRNKPLHDGAVIPGTPGNISDKGINILNNMRLADSSQLLQNIKLPQVVDVIGIGRSLLL